MAVYSMTGYASGQSDPLESPAQHDDAAKSLGIEIRSVNSRFLDLNFKLSEELRHHEPQLRTALTSRLKRGKIEVRLTLCAGAGTHFAEPSTRLLQRLNGLQDQVLSWLPQAAGLSVAEVLRLAADEGMPSEAPTPDLTQVVERVLQEFLAARAREGAQLAAVIQECTRTLRQLTERAKPLVPKAVEQQKLRFLERWNAAIGSADGISTEAAHERALSEATAYAIRIDVAEELSRLSAHLDEVERLLTHGGEIGKRLDFLSQELHREANTLGSKSASLEMTRIAIDMKVLIEQVREQVQNIE